MTADSWNFFNDDDFEDDDEQRKIDRDLTIKKLKELEARKNKLSAQVNTSSRKSRNHRYYKLGEIIENLLSRPLTDADIEKFEIFLRKEELDNQKFSCAMNNN